MTQDTYMDAGAAAHPGLGAAVIGRALHGEMLELVDGTTAAVIERSGTRALVWQGGAARWVYARDVAGSANSTSRPRGQAKELDRALAYVVQHGSPMCEPLPTDTRQADGLRLGRACVVLGSSEQPDGSTATYLQLEVGLRIVWQVWGSPLEQVYKSRVSGRRPACSECAGSGYSSAGRVCMVPGCAEGANAAMREAGIVLDGDALGWHQLSPKLGRQQWATRWVERVERGELPDGTGYSAYTFRMPDAIVTPVGVLHHESSIAPGYSSYRTPSGHRRYTITYRTAPGRMGHGYLLLREATPKRPMLPFASRAYAEAKLAGIAATCCVCEHRTAGCADCEHKADGRVYRAAIDRVAGAAWILARNMRA